ncbi:MAG TPA: thioredoxin family protein [Gammaproteobacteria bacterium]|nr:thioredoxin family protein [Gammaproteobacteria bacterium]
MSLTPSNMPELGRAAADFSLPDPSGKVYTLNDFSESKALLVIFMCNHCPFVIHLREALSSFASEYQARGLSIVGINANDISNRPDDSPAMMAEEIKLAGYTFPYLFDESQQTAIAYQAACTPDFFLYNGDRKLVYRGQFDSSRPGNGVPVTGVDLRTAVDALLAGQAISDEQKPSMGCNIKWRAGNEPKDGG